MDNRCIGILQSVHFFRQQETQAFCHLTLLADTCIDQRFTLRFRTLDDEGADGGIRIRLQDDGSICVSGLEPGQRIQAYSVGGQLEWKHVATESQCVFRLQRGVHLIEVSEGGTKRAVSKLMVP